MDDLKLKLSELENQVSSIKDPNLRKVAFEKLLENSLGTPLSKTSSHGKRSSKGKSSKGKTKPNPYYYDSKIRSEIKNMNVTGTITGMPPFKSCKSKIDCYIWIIAFAKKHKVDELNDHEIAYIMTKKLYKPTKYSTVYGIRRKVKEGLVIQDPDTESWRITPDGETYLQNLKQKDN